MYAIRSYYVIIIFQPERDEFVGSRNTVYKARPALNHPLIDKLSEWFLLGSHTDVIQKFVPETGIDKVSGCMFGTTDIEIYITPIVHRFF